MSNRPPSNNRTVVPIPRAKVVSKVPGGAIVGTGVAVGISVGIGIVVGIGVDVGLGGVGVGVETNASTAQRSE